jgi:hypothetical protein
MKNCPYCGGEIKDEASVCKYCGKGLIFMSSSDGSTQIKADQSTFTPPATINASSQESSALVDPGVKPQGQWIEENKIPDPAPFVTAPVEHKMKRCPYCAEEIRAEASICRYCGRNLSSTPVISETPVVNDRFESTIRDYQRNGYSLVSRMANSAIMERRAPIAGGLLAMWIVTFWIGAIIYGSEGNRKKYTVNINTRADGGVDVFGGTYEQVEKEKKSRNIIGWIIFSLVLATFICAIASGAYNQ